MTLQEILDKVSTTNVNDLRLYFITRVLKDNIKKSAKIIDKYLFKVYQVDIDDEIRQYLYDLSIEQLDKVIKKNYEILDYDVISDDTQHLFTYSMQNKIFSFSDVVCDDSAESVPCVAL